MASQKSASPSVSTLAGAAVACGALSMSGFVQGFTLPVGTQATEVVGRTQLSGSSRGYQSASHSSSAPVAPVVGSMLLAGLGLGVAGAAALSSKKSRSVAQAVVALQAFENELGVQAPVGFWDPVGFTADGSVENFKYRRSAELKHGRVAMLACMGYMTPEITGKFPGFLSPSTGLKFADIPNGLAAISKVPVLGWAQIVLYGAFVEYSSGLGKDWKTGTPGDLGWKAITSSDPEIKTRKLNSELANSRLAMTAILAMFVQNGTVGTTGPEMWTGKASVAGGAW